MRTLSRVLAFAAMALAVSNAKATTLYWSGTNTWDNGATQDWGTSTGGPYNTAVWANADNANFTGTAGAVTVSGTISSVNTITFATDGYTLSGGTINLTNTGGGGTLTGTTNPEIATSGGTDTINSVITGNSSALSLVKTGLGTLVLGGANTQLHAVICFGGVLSASTISDSGTSNIGDSSSTQLSVQNGATFQYTGSTAVTTGRKLDMSWAIGQHGNTASGGTFDITNASGSLTFTDTTGTLNHNLTKTGAGALSITNAINNESGSVLTQVTVNQGVLTHNGAGNYSGGTTLSGGMFLIGNNSALGTGSVTLNGGTLSQDSGANQRTIANNIIITGTNNSLISLAGVNGLTLNGNITGTGTVTDSSGGAHKLFLGGDNSGFQGTFVLGDGATSCLNAGSAASANATWTFSTAATSSMVINAEAAASTTTTYHLGALSDGGNPTHAYIEDDNNNNGSTAVFEIGALGTNTTFGGIFRDSWSTGNSKVAVTKVGTGTLTLTGANTYTGTTTVSAGALQLGNNSALGTGSVTLNGGTLSQDSGANQRTIANSIVITGANNSLISLAGANGLTLNGNITGTGTVTDNSGGSHKLFLGGDNSGFQGTFVLGDGATSCLNAGSAASANATWTFSTAATSSMVINAEAAASTTTTYHLGALSDGGNPTHAYIEDDNNNNGSTAVFEIGALGTNTTFGGIFRDSWSTGNSKVAVTKVGTGTLTLTGANTYTGTTTVSAGALQLGNNSALGTASVTLNGGALSQYGTSQRTIANNIVITGTNNSLTSLAGVNGLTLNGNITGTGTVTDNSGGSHKLFLGGDNSGFQGTFVLGDGATSCLNAGSAASANATWTFSTAATSSMVINAEAAASTTTTYRLGALSDGGNPTHAYIEDDNNNNGSTAVFEIGALGTNTTFGGIFRDSWSTGNSKVAVTKVGTGTLTLTGANTYTGATAVNGGVLLLRREQLPARSLADVPRWRYVLYRRAQPSHDEHVDLAGQLGD